MSNNKQSSLGKEFVPYEEALSLKELGFDEPCFVKIWWLNSINSHTKEPYKPHITMNGQDIKFEYPTPEKHPSTEFDILELQVPTFSQAFRWFREKYGIFNPQRLIFETLGGKYGLQSHDEHDQVDGYFDTYEEAELACLRKLIEIVKEVTNEQQ